MFTKLFRFLGFKTHYIATYMYALDGNKSFIGNVNVVAHPWITVQNMEDMKVAIRSACDIGEDVSVIILNVFQVEE